MAQHASGTAKRERCYIFSMNNRNQFAKLPGALMVHAVATTSKDTTSYLCNAYDGQMMHALTGHTGGACEIAFSPDNTPCSHRYR